MIRSKIRPFFIFLITVLFAVFIKNDFLRFLVGFEVLFYIALWMEARYFAGHVHGEIENPHSNVRKGQSFPVKVRVKNESRIPIPELMVRVAVRVFPEQEEVLMTGKLMLDAGEEGSLIFTMNSAHCGCMEVRLERIAVQDHLGIFQMFWFGQEERTFFFLFPKRKRLQSRSAKALTLQGEDGSMTKQGYVGEEIIDIRDYREGDLLKMVHWKLSARWNEIMVKELGKMGDQFFWVYLKLEEPVRKKGMTGRNRKLWDSFFENVETITYALFKTNQTYRVIWWNAERKRMEEHIVSDGESRKEMMRALLRTEGYTKKENAEIEKELSSYEAEDEIIEISLQGNIAGRFFEA